MNSGSEQVTGATVHEPNHSCHGSMPFYPFDRQPAYCFAEHLEVCEYLHASTDPLKPVLSAWI